MNFPEMERTFFKNISFLKPIMFHKGYTNNFVLSETHETYVISSIDLFLSTEFFNEEDVEISQFTSENEATPPLEAIHNNYIYRRSKSLLTAETSILKSTPKTVGSSGLIQVIHGKSNNSDKNTSYFIATIEVENEYYVFQLIGKRENMSYLYDDFITILSSIEK